MSQVLQSLPLTANPADLVRLPNDLTVKQKLFIHYYLETRNATRAAELAGYSGGSEVWASVGWENLRKPQIKAAIDEIYSRKLASPAQILAEVSEIATVPNTELATKDNPAPLNADHKLKAIELVGKHHKLWTDKVETETTLSDQDVERLGQSLFTSMLEAAERIRQKQLPASPIESAD